MTGIFLTVFMRFVRCMGTDIEESSWVQLPRFSEGEEGGENFRGIKAEVGNGASEAQKARTSLCFVLEADSKPTNPSQSRPDCT